MTDPSAVNTGPTDEEKAAKAAAAAEAKAKREAEKEAKAAERAAAKAAKEAAKAEAKAKKEADKLAKLEAAKAAKEANKMPEQNGIRRPKPDGLCGQAWDIFDKVSAKNGQPASIKESMEISRAKGLNDANVRAEYARWRKFNGVSGRVEPPKPVSTEPTPAPQA